MRRLIRKIKHRIQDVFDSDRMPFILFLIIFSIVISFIMVTLLSSMQEDRVYSSYGAGKDKKDKKGGSILSLINPANLDVDSVQQRIESLDPEARQKLKTNLKSEFDNLNERDKEEVKKFIKTTNSQYIKNRAKTITDSK